MSNTKHIYSRLSIHWQYAQNYADQHNAKLISVIVKGSQNYGLDAEDSDVDTVALILPSKETLIFGNKISTELHVPVDSDNTTENCVVKDIRLLASELFKGSPNMLELLFSEYYFDSIKFTKYMDKLRQNREKFVNINKDRLIDSLAGMGMSKTGKVYHMRRCYFMIKDLQNDVPFEKALKIEKDSPYYKTLMEIKKSNRDEKEEDYHILLKGVLQRTKTYSVDAEAFELLHDLIMDIFNKEM